MLHRPWSRTGGEAFGFEDPTNEQASPLLVRHKSRRNIDLSKTQGFVTIKRISGSVLSKTAACVMRKRIFKDVLSKTGAYVRVKSAFWIVCRGPSETGWGGEFLTVTFPQVRSAFSKQLARWRKRRRSLRPEATRLALT